MKLVISIALVTAFLLLPAGAEEVIKEFSGTDTFSTKPFTVPDNWEVHWDCKGQYLQILVNTEDSIPLGYAAQQMGPGSGSSVQPKGGTYILDMNASGDWKVKIVKTK